MDLEGFLLHELVHFLVGLFLGLLLYWRFQSKKLFLITISASLLIDLDHIFDYIYYLLNNNIGRAVFSVDYFEQSQKVFVLFHLWELVIFFAILGSLKKQPVFLSLSLALTGHLLVDQFTYHPNPFGYFLILRAVNHFNIHWFNGWWR